MVITKFIFRRSISSTLLWGIIFGVAILSSAVGFISAFPTAQDKAQLAAGFGSNAGLKAVLGNPHALATVAGFTEWRALGLITIIGALWGMMLVTKVLRGDEEEGRWELLLSGPTSKRRAALETFAALLLCLLIVFLLITGASQVANAVHDISFSWKQSIYFGFAGISSAALFMAVGAFTSQIASSRRQALGIAAGIFGLCFAARAIADSTTGYDWLRDISPLGWIEKIQPLTGQYPVSFIYLAVAIIVFALGTILIASRRDLGTGILPERDSRAAHTKLLNSPWGLALRLTETNIITWIIASAIATAAFSGVAKSAAQSFANAQPIQQVLSSITNNSNSAALFLGLMFMLLMIVIMVMTAGMVIAIREEEGSGRLDTLLVRPVSRATWLLGRILIVFLTLLGTSLVIGIVGWLVTHAQGIDLGKKTMLLAGLNTAPPSIFLLGAGILTMAILPRLTPIVTYGIIAMSFLIQFLAAALSAPTWVLDLSVLRHVALAPGANPDWHSNGILALVGIIAAAIGLWYFTKRDIVAE